MRRYWVLSPLIAVLVVLLTMMSPGVASAAVEVDQSNENWSGASPPIRIYNEGSLADYFGQAFTAGKTGLLTQIDLALTSSSPDVSLNDTRVVVYKTVRDGSSVHLTERIGEGYIASSEVDSSGVTWQRIYVSGVNGEPLHIEKRNEEVGNEGTYAFLVDHDATKTTSKYLFVSGGTTYSGGRHVEYYYCSYQPYICGTSGAGQTLFRTYVDTTDTDADGTTDDIDQCVSEPGPSENNGCPWPDTDGDGITDNIDGCPSQAGPSENNGCPWPDTDGDGVTDNVDQCPSQAGPSGNNGCPLPPSNTAPTVSPLRPVPGSTIADRTPNIVAKVADAEKELLKRDTRLYLNGTLIPRSGYTYDSSLDKVTYTVPSPLAYREHTVRIDATDGQLTTIKRWKFTIAAP